MRTRSDGWSKNHQHAVIFTRATLQTSGVMGADWLITAEKNKRTGLHQNRCCACYPLNRMRDHHEMLKRDSEFCRAQKACPGEVEHADPAPVTRRASTQSERE